MFCTVILVWNVQIGCIEQNVFKNNSRPYRGPRPNTVSIFERSIADRTARIGYPADFLARNEFPAGLVSVTKLYAPSSEALGRSRPECVKPGCTVRDGGVVFTTLPGERRRRRRPRNRRNVFGVTYRAGLARAVQIACSIKTPYKRAADTLSYGADADHGQPIRSGVYSS